MALIAISLVCGIDGYGQTNQDTEVGVTPYESFSGGSFDHVSLNNGNLFVHIPLVDYPQRGGKLKLSFSLQGNIKNWTAIKCPSSGGTVCTPQQEANGDYYYTSSLGSSIVVADDQQWTGGIQLTGDCHHGLGVATVLAYSPDGASHKEGVTSGTGPVQGLCQSGAAVTLATSDGSGTVFSGTNSGVGTLTTRDGIQNPKAVTSPGVLRIDSNGNEISETTATVNGGTGYYYLDTLGRSIAFPPNGPFSPLFNGPTGTQDQNTTNYSGCTGPLAITSATDWSIPGPNGGTSTYKFCYATITLATYFYGGTNSNLEGGGACKCLQSVVLPNGTSWEFEYQDRDSTDPSDVNYGSLTKITLPTGGTVVYTYVTGSFCTNSCPAVSKSRAVATRTVNANDGTGSHIWSYSWLNNTTSGPPPTTQVFVTDPLKEDTVYTMAAMDVYRETIRQIYPGSHKTTSAIETITTSWPVWSVVYPPTVLPSSITTAWPNGKTKQTTYTYDTGIAFLNDNNVKYSFGDEIKHIDYDYGSGAAGPILKQTSTTYEWQLNSNYTSANLLDQPSSVVVQNSSGVECAETDYGYDATSLLTGSGITTQHTSPPGPERGNLTSTTKKLSTTPCTSGATWSSITSTKNVYDTGEVYQSTDPLGNVTTYTYDPTFIGAYVTKTQLPNTNVNGADTNAPSPTTHITNDWYDFNTGLKDWHKDENSQETSYSYEAMWRIQTITPPSPEGGTTFTYNDTPGSLSVERTQTINSTQTTNAYTLFDGLGRSVSKVVANGQSTPYDKTDTCYDARGSKNFVSYPYQTTTWNSWPSCPISQVGDSYAYDALKRTTSVTHSDATAMTYSYVGAATSATDEGNGTRGVQHISQVDGLGRLTSACEVTSVTLAVGTDHTPIACNQDISGTGFLTSYSYDPLGNLLSVSQGSNLNPRTFTYDSLSRLITTTNPEAGSTCFGTWSGSTCAENYDADSNVLSRTRPAPNQSSSTTYVTATYTYDTLNRVLTKAYSDGTTPTATFDYDETSVKSNTLTNTTGRLSSEYTGPSTAVTSESILSYNPPGWTVEDIQCTPQNCANGTYLTFNYGYDGVGDVTSSGNGIIFTYALTYSVAPRLTQITTNWFSPTVSSGTVISGLQYNSFGEPLSASLNDSIIAETWSYDTRGRMKSDTALAYSDTLYSLTNLSYSGNSDVLTATDSVNGTWSNYTYDDFNRLVSSTCSTACPQGVSSVAFSYTYDRYGNRWQQTLTEGSGSWPQPSYSFDANNRISTSDGFTFDAAGNIINDTIHTYTYDAENRIVQVDGGSTAVYAYDAEGRRVAKTAATAGGAFEYLFDLQGRAVTELGAGTKNINRTEIYGGGRHLATQNVGLSTTYFTHNDWLGTERVRSSLSGTVAETCQSLPYGDVLNCTGAQASALHFTGKMRDAETNLTEFPARYYSPAQGRWYSPDWASAQVPVPYADLHNPQTLNLYDYVGSDPTNHADADGHTQGQDELVSTWVFDEANNLALGTFRKQSQQDGDSQSGDSQSSCEAEMRSRPGDITAVHGHGASHAWWWVVSSTGQDYTLSFTMKITLVMVPTPMGPVPVPEPVLNAYAAEGPQSSSNKNDNLGNGAVIFDTTGPAACAGVSKMIQATKSFPQDQVPYGPVEGSATSNSGARYLGAVGGFNPPMPNQPGLQAVGWDLRIPGVEQ